VLRGGDPAAHLVATLPSAKVLKLVVENGGDDYYYDHADIADPKISCGLAPAPATLTVTPASSNVTIYDLTSVTVPLNITSNDPALHGPFDVRLEEQPDSSVFDPSVVTVLDLQLKTPQIDDLGSQSIAFSAPGINRNNRRSSAEVDIIISKNGVTLARVPLNVVLLYPEVSGKFTPSAVSGHDGDVISGTFQLTLKPKLDLDVIPSIELIDSYNPLFFSTAVVTGSPQDLSTTDATVLNYPIGITLHNARYAPSLPYTTTDDYYAQFNGIGVFGPFNKGLQVRVPLNVTITGP
jgi:hypothetical protein